MMVRKKILSLVMITVLITSGLAIIGSQSAKADSGEQVHTIDFGISTDIESGVENVYEGELDLFMNSLDFPDYQELPEEWRMGLETWEARTSYNNLFINPAHEGHGTEAMQDAIDERWIDESEEVQWLANNFDGEWTVNPFAHEDIRFTMQYLNRREIVDELLDGFGDPRYSYMDTESEIWQNHFVEALKDEYDMSPEGDIELMEQMIEDAMEEIKENVAFGEVRYEEGYWQYRPPEEDWHDIEIIIVSRTEDWRDDLGEYMVDILQGLGFNARNEYYRMQAPQIVFFGSPEPYDSLRYHIYTGGWISSQAEYYQEKRVSQYHAPWYSFMQTYNIEEHWNYDEEGYTQRVQQLDNLSKELFQGQIESEEEYWEKKIEATQLGFEESVRVFLLTEFEFYPYNPDALLNAVSESIGGYDTYFGPRTMRTDDGVLEIGDDRSQYRTYWDNWNKYGGSEEFYGEYKRRVLREYGSWNHPRTGKPMEVNVYWSEGIETDPYERKGDVEWDYEWTEEDELIENIPIPENAVDYVPEDGEWKTVEEIYESENRTAAVKVTLDVHEEHIWHDGTDFTLQHVMANYAREKRLACHSEEPYLESWEATGGRWYDTIHALEWDEEEGTYTIYGNYTFPIEDKVGDHYATFPEVHPLTYEGWDHMHGESEIYNESGLEEKYDYSMKGDSNWIHQMSPEQNADLVTVLQTLIDEEYLPQYLDEKNDAPIPMNFDDFETQLTSLIDFIDEYGHSFVGVGPFYIEEYTDKHQMSVERWEDYGYPDHYWSEQFLTEEELEPYFEVTITDYDEESYEGKTITVEYELNNTGKTEDKQNLNFTVNGELVETDKNITLSSGENKIGEFTWESTQEGEYEIEIASEDDKDTVNVTVKEEKEEIPGFSPSILLISILTAVIWYRRKVKDRREKKR